MLTGLAAAIVGALGGILSSRLSSKLHLGVISPKALPEPIALLDSALVVVSGLFAFLAVGTIGYVYGLFRGANLGPGVMIGGTVLTGEETAALASAAPRAHLDGARLANASVALGVPLAVLAAPVDTVALSLNKGLCAPFGTILAGTAETIAEARVHLKRLGGATVHKAGIFAAAGLLALGMIERLAEDHRRARELARLIGADPPETNIVHATLGPGAVEELAARGVLALQFANRVRFVTHRLIGATRSIHSQAWYIQVGYRLPASAKLWKPYYRFEYIHIPRTDPILGAVPSLAGSVAGVRYDISNFAAIKFEYRNQRRPGQARVNGAFIQTSFTF